MVSTAKDNCIVSVFLFIYDITQEILAFIFTHALSPDKVQYHYKRKSIKPNIGCSVPGTCELRYQWTESATLLKLRCFNVLFL